jgi:hypothetical protein
MRSFIIKKLQLSEFDIGMIMLLISLIPLATFLLVQ